MRCILLLTELLTELLIELLTEMPVRNRETVMIRLMIEFKDWLTDHA